MLAADNGMTAGRVEFAPNYGRWLDDASPTGRHQQPMEVDPRSIKVGIVTQPHPSGDNTFLRPPVFMPPANDNRHLPKVVAITGLAGAGKSTLADYLVKRHGYVRVKFAGPLKDMARAVGLGEDHIEGTLKETPVPFLNGKTPRQFMQLLGTEFGRELIGADFWTGLWSRTANDILDNGGRVVCDDCRFDNEADTVRALGGVVLQIAGRGGIPGGHTSEAGVDADVVLHNTGSILELQGRADEALFGWR